jgi:hypothetical protein
MALSLAAFSSSCAVERSHYIGADDGGEKPYRLLAEAMAKTKRAALAELVTRGKEQLVLIRPYQNDLMLHALYLVLDGFGEPCVSTFGCGLPGSWACEASGRFCCFMILLPGGGSLFEMTLCNHSETKKKGETKCKVQSHTSPRVSDP